MSARDVPLPAVSVSDDGPTWRAVDGVRRLPEWGWAGRTLFEISGPAQELSLPATPARYVRLELRLPDRDGPAITRLCARGEPLS